MITIDGKLNFSKEITKFFENENLQQNLGSTKEEWSSIISRNTNEKIDNGIKYPGEVVNPR
jgi:hypothetical protein